jgi:hypothetical protein
MRATRLHSFSLRTFAVIGLIAVAGALAISAPAGAAPAKKAAAAVGAAVFSVRSGRWSDPNTWSGAQVPITGAAVAIRSGHDIIVDVDARVAGVTLEGALRFDPTRNVTLESTRNIVVTGALTMRPASPALVHRVRFVDVDNSKFVGGGVDPIDSDVGLWVVGAGRLDMLGESKTAWTNLAGELAAGQASGITLRQAPSGWQAGDEIFVAPTEAPTAAVGKANWLGFEHAALTGVQGNAISLSSPAVRTHPVVNAAWTAEVGNVTRNVKVEGTSGGFSHIFVRSTAPQSIRYTELMYMGVGDLLGRYPLHFHHGGNGTRGSVVEGVAIHASANHAFVPHASHGISFVDTIAYDVGNDAYWWDVDNPKSKGNGSDDISFRHALAARIHGPSGIGLSGFRLGQADHDTNSIRDSVATGVEGHTESSGFSWKMGTSGWTFDNNVTHNNKVNGVFIWQNDGRDHQINGLASYYNRNGIYHGAYKNEYHYRDAVSYGNSASGIVLTATASQNGIRFDNLRIDGAGITPLGIRDCCHQIEGVRYPTVITNCSITNTTVAAVWIAGSNDRRRANSIRMENCALGGTPFRFQAGAAANTTIEVANPSEHFLVTSGTLGTQSTFVGPWNAWKTPAN